LSAGSASWTTRQVAEGGDDGRDVVGCHLALPGRGADLGLGGDLLGLRLGDPRTDDCRASPRLEAFPVLADLGVILGDPRAGRFHLRPCGGVFQRYRPLGKFGEGDVEAVRGELLGEPVIDAAEYVSFAQVDRLGVVEVVG
jgi:hypothetical protein